MLGPGSLYTSVIPNLLIPEVRRALKETRAWVVYVCNVMTQPGETDGYTAADHLDALYRHGMSGLVDVVLVNETPVSPELLASYERFGARPVQVDDDRLKRGRQGGARVRRRGERRRAPRLGAPGAGARAHPRIAMSFTRDVKLELGTIVPAAEHCRRAQLSGMLFGAGVFEIGAGGRYGVRVSLGLPATARHVLGLLKPFGVAAEVRTMDSAPLGLRYEVMLGDEARDLQLLNELGVLSDDLRVQMMVPRRLLERRCCVVAFLRGLFLGCGSISAPGAPVHVEFTVADEDFAQQVQALLARLELHFKLVVRERNVACYSKRSQTGADLLAVLGAHDGCLRWEEHVVLGPVRESANRLANCDEANARRAAAAGERQAALLRRLMASPAWAALPAACARSPSCASRSPI